MDNKQPGKAKNIVLWILQILLAFYFITGGLYMMQHYQSLASEWATQTLPDVTWIILGILQIAFAAGLLIPVFVRISAVALSCISLTGIALYAAYSGSGMLWSVVPAALLVLIAFGRAKK